MTSHITNPEVLEVQVYHGAEGSFLMAEDDCSGRRSAPVLKTRFTYELPGDKDAVFRMELADGDTGLIPADRAYQITIFGVQKPESVQVQGVEEFEQTYREQDKALYIELRGRSIRRFEIQLSLADREIAGQDKEQQIFTILQRAQIEYILKDRIYDAVTRGRNTAGVLAALTEMQVEPALYGAVTEILTMDL